MRRRARGKRPRFRVSSRFINQQWLWYNIAGMAAAIAGGHLFSACCRNRRFMAPRRLSLSRLSLLSPEHYSWFRSGKVAINILSHERTSSRSLQTSLKRRRGLADCRIFVLYNFSPGLSTPLYFTMTDTLKFSQSYIGILSSILALGWIVGACSIGPFLAT